MYFSSCGLQQYLPKLLLSRTSSAYHWPCRPTRHPRTPLALGPIPRLSSFSSHSRAFSSCSSTVLRSCVSRASAVADIERLSLALSAYSASAYTSSPRPDTTPLEFLEPLTCLLQLLFHRPPIMRQQGIRGRGHRAPIIGLVGLLGIRVHL